MNDLQFLSETGNLLVIRNPVQILSWLPCLLFVILTLILGFVHTQIRGQSNPGSSFFVRHTMPVLWGFSAFIFVFIGVWSHTLTVSASASNATIQDRWMGVTYRTQSVPLAQLDSVVTESARGGMRVAIVLKGGNTLYPFGHAYNTMPSQYRAIQDIRGFISPGTAHDDTGNVEQRIQQKIRESEESTRPSSQK